MDDTFFPEENESNTVFDQVEMTPSVSWLRVRPTRSAGSRSATFWRERFLALLTLVSHEKRKCAVSIARVQLRYSSLGSCPVSSTSLCLLWCGQYLIFLLFLETTTTKKNMTTRTLGCVDTHRTGDLVTAAMLFLGVGVRVSVHIIFSRSRDCNTHAS